MYNKYVEKTEIIKLLQSDGTELFKEADRLRHECVGDEVLVRGLIEFSNYCRQNCLYCGIRGANDKVDRYRLTPQEIIELAQSDYKTFVLQSGEDPYFTTEILCDIVKEIKKRDVAVTLSIGERDDYEQLKAAGADRFLLRIETTNPELYAKMHPGMSLESRKECLFKLKELGYETGTGCLVGLPGQTLEMLADDILFFKKLQADMVGLGPFIPCQNTPLGDSTGGTFDLALKVMAITRLVLPDINIPATTAMETLETGGREKALQSGANVVMINITPENYRKKYEIYRRYK